MAAAVSYSCCYFNFVVRCMIEVNNFRLSAGVGIFLGQVKTTLCNGSLINWQENSEEL